MSCRVMHIHAHTRMSITQLYRHTPIASFWRSFSSVPTTSNGRRCEIRIKNKPRRVKPCLEFLKAIQHHIPFRANLRSSKPKPNVPRITHDGILIQVQTCQLFRAKSRNKSGGAESYHTTTASRKSGFSSTWLQKSNTSFLRWGPDLYSRYVLVCVITDWPTTFIAS